ncbi:BrnT family toxin [bacterium]|nr:BrnT family toxin [bacterium]
MKVIGSIRWKAESIDHIARHGVKPEEIEQVCFNEENVPLIKSGKENLHYVFGKTDAGRLLFMVVRFLRPGEVKMITARDMDAWEKNYFKKRGK